MSQYLVFPYGKVISAESYRHARTLAEARYGKIVATTVLLLESAACQG